MINFGQFSFIYMPRPAHTGRTYARAVHPRIFLTHLSCQKVSGQKLAPRSNYGKLILTTWVQYWLPKLAHLHQKWTQSDIGLPKTDPVQYWLAKNGPSPILAQLPKTDPVQYWLSKMDPVQYWLINWLAKNGPKQLMQVILIGLPNFVQ